MVNNMKPLKIPYGKNKNLIITKDFISIFMGVLILVADALLAGILQLFEFGFDLSYLKTTEFWTSYAIKLAISYTALFGAYIIKKNANKQNPKFLIQREKIKESKDAIVKARKIANCKNWLKFVYNYTKKVEIYQDIITKKYEKLVYAEPEEPDKDSYNLESFFGRLKYNNAKANYHKALNQYKKTEEHRKYCERQLMVCDKHFEIIAAYKKHDMEEVKRLQDEIKDIDCMKNYRLRYKNITYNRLFNVDLGSNKHDNSIDYNEAGMLAKKILPAIITGLISCTLLSSLFVKTQAFSLNTILLIVLNLFLMAWFTFTGIRIADSFILGTVYAADGNRLIICEEFIEDCALNGDAWTQEIDTCLDLNVETGKEKQAKDAGVPKIEDVHIPPIRNIHAK